MMRKSFVVLMMFGAFALISFGLVAPAVAQQRWVNSKTIEDSLGNKLEIHEWTNGLKRSKYVVMTPSIPNSRKWWFTQDGSANKGIMEGTRFTSNQEWCRVRYLYGDDVRVPECWGQFMYSSHLITGLDGKHYELWFSPSSLSYFKIRNQETNVWYAHDGSANDGRLKTTKDQWCRIIYYNMTGIIELPEECKETQKYIVNAIAGTSGQDAQNKEMAYVREMIGAAPLKSGGAVAGEIGTAIVDKLASGSVGFDKLNYTKTGSLTGSSAIKTGVAGVGVGIAVDYGVDAIKNAAGWKAKDANAGAIAAEVITTTVATSAITTAIMTAAGATFNPITVGVGLLIAGGFATGEEISKASKDTGIRLVPNYYLHPRHNRDINGITEQTFVLKVVPPIVNK